MSEGIVTPSQAGGCGFLGLLTLLLIALKATGNIMISWLWVLAPTWIPLAIAALCGVILLAVMAFAYFSENH